MILNRYNQNLNTGDNIMATNGTNTNSSTSTSNNTSSYTALDVLLNSSASDTSVISSHSINPTPMSSEYSLSNRSSLADVSFNALDSINNDINNLNSLNTMNSINSLNDSFDNDASTIDVNNVNNINNAGNNPNGFINNLWNSTSENSNLPSNSTFINWNPNYLNSNQNNNHNDNPILSKPTSPVPQSFATLRNSKNLQFSSNDPFLPADLKSNDLATVSNNNLDDAIYKISSSESLYKCLSNHLLSNSININKAITATTNTSLNNESLLNNQFLNKPAFPINNNPMAGYSWNANVGLLNISDDLNNHQSSSSYSNSSTASSVCDDLINHNYYQNHLNNMNHANNTTSNNTHHHNNSNQLNKSKSDRLLFKTELCATFQKTGFCPYNDKCQFAHGLDELKSAPKSRKWKTKMCKNWTEKGHCRYGKRCCYKHGENDDGSSLNSLLPPQVVLKH
ncbi:hypothetical protein PMKS-000504 [Pichia membranifaciens]|uniref:C3H1-type domain-containing protein n=1 Tax=Pichia membranifaciens TaxID=4926 RepID=A0A1Q2YCA4_9ASCO|nr:hypothetical protein PMKS-000504 [Pichia membranifaciens]